MMGLSGAAASDFEKALALIQAFSNPAGVTAHIELVRAEEAKAAERIKEANEAQATADANRQRWEQNAKDRIANLDRREGELDARQNEIDRKETDLKRRNDAMLMADAANRADRKQLEADQRALADAKTRQEADIEARKRVQDAREADLDARAVNMDKREADLAAREAAYEERLKALNAALKPVRG